jgi:gamma-glutamyltranspeptidase/glutathione hydrolase
MLNILEVCAPAHGIDLADLGPTSPDHWHFMVEAKKLAYSDLYAYNADPKFADVAVEELLSKEYAATLCTHISTDRASEPSVEDGLDGGTIYLTTADRWGNMVSFVHSVFSVYGSGATVRPYGFTLHNRGSAFSLDPARPNVVAPRKRPFHSIIAGFVMQGGRPVMSFGNMGGSVQPETHVQHMVNVIDHGMNLQMTTDAARLHAQSSLDPPLARGQPLQPGGSGPPGEGPPGGGRGGQGPRRLSGHTLHARPRPPAAELRAREHPVKGAARDPTTERTDRQPAGRDARGGSQLTIPACSRT